MSDVTNKSGQAMAQVNTPEDELDQALQDAGLPMLRQIGKAGVDFDNMPEIMRLCSLEPRKARHAALASALANGADPNAACPWGAMPIDTLYTDSDGCGIAILINFGADASDYGWSDAHKAVIFNDLPTLDSCDPQLLVSADHLGDTPFMLACRLGRDEIAHHLMPQTGSDAALLVAARCGDVEILRNLIAAGADVNASDELGQTPLLLAVEHGHVELVAFLLREGASIDAKVDISTPRHVTTEDGARLETALDFVMNRFQSQIPALKGPIYNTIYSLAQQPDVIRLLVAHGADPTQFEADAFPVAVGLDQLPPPNVSRDEFAAQYRVRYGRFNPEQVDVPFWRAQMRSGASGYQAKSNFAGPQATTDGPVWSFQRFGRSATQLPNGSWVLIGGEHEDHYDPDFCIYNDVTVVRPDGGIRHYTYPPTVFPPHDFHTATLANDGIWIIGGLGYPRDREVGVTRVYWMSLIDMSIHVIGTTGQNPGWIHGHTATFMEGSIFVSGGRIAPDDVPAKSAILDLKSRRWHAVN